MKSSSEYVAAENLVLPVYLVIFNHICHSFLSHLVRRHLIVVAEYLFSSYESTYISGFLIKKY
jgi:hypothetical protein